MKDERKQDIASRCRFNANSYQNGIIFIPRIYGCDIGISVMETEDGEISEKHYMNASFNDITEDDNEVKLSYMTIPGERSLMFYSIILLIVCYIKKQMIMFPGLEVLLLALPEIVFTIKTVFKMKISGENKSLGRYHSAEHKAINAYRKLKRAPKTMEELNKYSRFSKNCGVKERVIWAVPKITFFLAWMYTYDVINTLIITVIVSFVLMSLIKVGVFRFLQIFVTEKPTDKELYLALIGIQAVDEVISSAKIGKEDGKTILYINYPDES